LLKDSDILKSLWIEAFEIAEGDAIDRCIRATFGDRFNTARFDTAQMAACLGHRGEEPTFAGQGRNRFIAFGSVMTARAMAHASVRLRRSQTMISRTSPIRARFSGYSGFFG
jgi:hypothetical protein